MAKLLRVPAVLARIGISRSTLYQWIKDGTFPPAVNLGARSVGWFESDVDEWIKARACRARGVHGEADAARTAA